MREVSDVTVGRITRIQWVFVNNSLSVCWLLGDRTLQLWDSCL